MTPVWPTRDLIRLRRRADLHDGQVLRGVELFLLEWDTLATGALCSGST